MNVAPGQTGQTDEESRLFAVASVTNQGQRTVADEWGLRVGLPGQLAMTEAVNVDLVVDENHPLTLQGEAGWMQQVVPENILFNMTMKAPIPTGMKYVGVLSFAVLIRRDDVKRAGTRFELRCQDVAGNVVVATVILPSKGKE